MSVILAPPPTSQQQEADEEAEVHEIVNKLFPRLITFMTLKTINDMNGMATLYSTRKELQRVYPRISFGSIYPARRILERKGLITVRKELTTFQILRVKVYLTITPKGTRVLTQWKMRLAGTIV